jgi:hypothetical protein
MKSNGVRLAPTQRQVRILELRNYAEKNYNSILEAVEREIREEGWIRSDDDFLKANVNNQPGLRFKSTQKSANASKLL